MYYIWKVGRKYIIVDEQGVIQPRKYKYFELKSVDPLNVEGKTNGMKEIEKDKEAHTKITKTRKATGTNYDDAVDFIKNKYEPKAKRILKKVVKYNI